jgi:phage-related protein
MLTYDIGSMMVTNPLREITVIFYRSNAGGEPVREWLRDLPEDDRRKIGGDLATVQVGWPVGMPLCRFLGSGLWEVRSNLPSRRIARVLFFVQKDRIGVVHGFIKKTQKTPQDDLELARKRMKEMNE